jgi:hypothetical protein
MKQVETTKTIEAMERQICQRIPNNKWYSKSNIVEFQLKLMDSDITNLKQKCKLYLEANDFKMLYRQTRTLSEMVDSYNELHAKTYLR